MFLNIEEITDVDSRLQVKYTDMKKSFCWLQQKGFLLRHVFWWFSFSKELSHCFFGFLFLCICYFLKLNIFLLVVLLFFSSGIHNFILSFLVLRHFQFGLCKKYVKKLITLKHKLNFLLNLFLLISKQIWAYKTPVFRFSKPEFPFFLLTGIETFLI